MIHKLLSYKRPTDLKSNGGLLIYIAIIILIFIMAATTPLDTDFWWQIRSGEASWTSGRPVMVDQFSYTRMGETWTNHQWLSQIVMYGLYQKGGFLAISAAIALIAATSMGLIYKQIEGPAIIKAFILILTATVSSPLWVPRPEIASLVLLAVASFLLYLYKWKRKDRLWLFVPLFILWSNLHGGYVLGIGLIGAMIAGEILNRFLGFDGDEVLSFRRIARLGGWLLVCILAVLVNPNGIRTWLIPFQTVGVVSLQNYIVEWASPDFHQFFQQPFIWMVLAVIGAIGFSFKRLDATDFITFAIFSYAALLARRNFGPFAIVAAPILGRHLWPALQSWYIRIKPAILPALMKIPILGKASIKTSREQVIPGRTRVINFSIISILMIIALFKVYLVTSPALVNINAQNLPR